MSKLPVRNDGCARALSFSLLFVLLMLCSRCGPKYKPGQLKWAYETEGSIGEASPSIAPDGTIYCGSSDGHMYALTPEGKLKWRYEAGGPIATNAAIADDGTIYFGAESSFYALNPDSTLNWRFPTHGSFLRSPAIAGDGTVYCPSDDENVYALNPNGTVKWTCHLGGCASSFSIGPDGTLFTSTCTRVSNTVAISPLDGTIKWTIEGLSYGIPAIDKDSTIYTGNVALIAYKPDGAIRMQFGRWMRSSPVIGTDGTIYYGGVKTLLAVKPEGALKWEDTIGVEGDIYSTPAISTDGAMYFGCDDRHLRATDQDGILLWQQETYGAVRSSPAIGSGGTVYFGCDDGSIYAVQGSGKPAPSPWPMLAHDTRRTGRFGAD